MRNSNKKKKIITCSVLLFSFLSITIFTNFNFEPPFYKDDANKDDFINFPKTSDSLPSFNGVGDKVNISLHQSYLNNSFNTALSPSDPNNNSFSLPCPTDTHFNSSFTNVTIENIYAPNKTLIVEGDTQTVWTDVDEVYASFEVQGAGYIENITTYLRYQGSGYNLIDIYLFKAEDDNSNLRPLDSSGVKIYDDFNVSNTTPQWLTVGNIHHKFNTSETVNNTYFLYMLVSELGNTYSATLYDDEGTDALDESIVLDSSETPIQLFVSDWTTIDLSLKLYVSPLNNTPSPEQVNLKINNTIATGYGDGIDSGYWESTNINSSASGTLKYNVSADWWDVTCDISKVQINYTKTGLRADSSFEVLGNGQDVLWNVTKPGGLNYFDSRFNDYTINFTISSRWENVEVWNGGTNKTSDIKTNIFNHYKDIQVFNAGNGTYWFLNATSNNLLQSIDIYKGLTPIINSANFTDIVHFNATFFTDIDSTIPSDNGINLSIYSPFPNDKLNYTSLNTTFSGDKISLGDWNISDTVDDYGDFRVQVFWNNGTAAGLIERNITILAETQLSLIDPPDKSNFEDNKIFNITVYYEDTGFGVGIGGVPDEIISENSTKNLQRYTNGTDGYYFVEVDTNLFSWGWHTIEINASKHYYNNQSITFSFHKQINTTITPENTPNLGNILKGDSVNYTFNYTDVNNNAIIGATLKNVSLPSGIKSTLYEIGNGNYTIELNTTDFDVTGLPSICSFNISSVGNQTQNIDITIRVISAQTEVQIKSFIDPIPRHSNANQTIKFYFNDTIENDPITGLDTNDVIVRDYDTGMIWDRGDHNWTLIDNWDNGTYILDVSTNGLDAGWYTLELNVSDIPNYNSSYAYVTFYLRGNYANIGLVSITDPGGPLTPLGPSNNFSCYISSNLDFEFNLTEAEFGDIIVLGDADSYIVQYENLDNSSIYGSLSHTFDFDLNSETHKGGLTTQSLAIGEYSIEILLVKKNYENATYTFYLIVKDKLDINISIHNRPFNVNAGESFIISFFIELYNGTDWVPLDVDVELTPYIDGSSASALFNNTNIDGFVYFEIFIPNDAINITLSVNVDSIFYHKNNSINVQGFTVIPLDTGLTFEDLLPYIIMIGAVVAVVGGSLAVYRGVVVPKKREKQRILTEVKTIFDDAINLEHILVLYKGTGTCIFFKSYGSEQIDPELIGGFLTAVSSFGKEMATQEALNEITYGDKMLLLADGQFIRVALVLGKKGSLILRRHLKEFIDSFEKTYKEVLPNWRGQLNHFRNAGIIVDEILNTSIILPHQISYDFSSVKELKNSFSKDVLKVAHSCCEEAEREFFFVATLLKEASEKTSKDTAEIFMGIKELRDKKILMPIEISTIEAQPISQQELNLINQKVASLTTLTNDERQKLVNDLGQLGPIEREAYLSSLTKQHEIVSAPIKTTIGTIIVDNKKSAQKGVKELSKRAKIAKGKNNYQKTIELYQSAAMLASNWELSNEFVIIEEIIRKTKIEDLIAKKKDLEKEAKDAVKSKNYAEASAKYKYASKTASEIFKLGANSMIKEVKRLTKKANEYEKLK